MEAEGQSARMILKGHVDLLLMRGDAYDVEIVDYH
jgi:hypothetical protein